MPVNSANLRQGSVLENVRSPAMNIGSRIVIGYDPKIDSLFGGPDWEFHDAINAVQSGDWIIIW